MEAGGTIPTFLSSVGSLYGPAVADVEIGQLVRAWRKRRGYTQESLAKAARAAGLKLSEAQISHVEAGRRNLSADSADAVANLLQLSVEEHAQLHDARLRAREAAARKSAPRSALRAKLEQILDDLDDQVVTAKAADLAPVIRAGIERLRATLADAPTEPALTGVRAAISEAMDTLERYAAEYGDDYALAAESAPEPEQQKKGRKRNRPSPPPEPEGP